MPDGRPFGARFTLPRLQLPPVRLPHVRLTVTSIVAVGKAIIGVLALLLALYVLYACVSIAVAIVDVFVPDGESPETQVSEVYDRFVGHRTSYPFTSTEVRSHGDYYIACARPENYRRTFCLLVRPERPDDQRVIGWYTRWPNRPPTSSVWVSGAVGDAAHAHDRVG